jgi:GH15 family glucan-1,4-alpha-glucosidase
MSARGYAPIRDYAAIGDGRTVALVARDGSIDWLCFPDLDSPSVFGAVLDAGRGGRFALEPDGRYDVERRYRPGTNVLETTFRTADGVVRVTDAMTLPDGELSPAREVARRIEGLAGRVPMRWRVEPRFGYGLARTRLEARGPIPVATSGATAVALCAWDAGDVVRDASGVGGAFEARAGQRALLALVGSEGEPLVFPTRAGVERRLDDTARFWEGWTRRLVYDGRWRSEVERSALLLKLLVFAPSGAIAAAPTTSLPEAIGGERNWDYRFCWIRDSSFILEALLQLGCRAEAHSFFWWFMHATRLTHPRLQVFYRLDGGAHAPERALPLAGYRDSRPVRAGNGAAAQLQLDTYGNLLDTAWLYATKGDRIDRETGAALGAVADLVCDLWREPDHGIWEVRMARQHFTQSKVMCWVALDRAARLAERGDVPARNVERWRREARAVRDFVETRCWSERRRAYVRHAGSEDLDASVLLMAILRYGDPRDARIVSTIEAIRTGLGRGPLVYRYTGEDGLAGGEGVFLCCSFWLVEALALAGRRDEAAETMDKLIGLANDVGLYAEEIDPDSHAFLGNFPQGLVHLALVSAARALTGGPAAR